jgi:CubicO group peptidase (beta-lactamase class C family)
MKSASLLALGIALATPATALPPGFSQRAETLVNRSWPADGPGAAVIVTEGGKPVYEHGRGLADVEAKVPITPSTVFRIGSVTKQFAAAVVLQLASEGKLSLDDPLSKFIPNYPPPSASATVRQLLNHTSGIQSYTGIPGWMTEANVDKPYTTAQLIDVFKNYPSPTKPGEAWAYNNSGYILVGAIIEKVTGRPWYEAVHERIAAPLHLGTLRYGVGEDGVPNMAKGYSRTEDGSYKPAEKIHMSVPGAAGSLIGTVGDLATWANALHHGKVVTSDMYRTMTTKTKSADGKVVPYGFGLQLDQLRGHPTIGHGGGIYGFATSTIYIPERDVFVAVFANSAPSATPPDNVAIKLAMLAIGDPFPDLEKQRIDLKAVEPLLGTYKAAGSDDQRVFFSHGGKLFTRVQGAELEEVLPAGNGRFFYEGGTSWFDLKQDRSGTEMKIYRQDASGPETATRVGPVPAEARPADVPRSVLQRYVGSYSVQGQIAIITLGEDGLSVKVGSQPSFRLIPHNATEFTVESVGAGVVFNGPDGGSATSMTIHQGGQSIEAPRKQ